MSFRLVLVLFASLILQPGPTVAWSQTSQPMPPGHRAANDATRQSEKVEPPVTTRPTATLIDVQKQTDELLSLAQQVHANAPRAAQGVVDKDLKDQLKRIEKLSKKLRDELAL